MSFLNKAFGFDPKVNSARTEIVAGITTFLAMSYILAVNPNIFGAISMDHGAVFTATALASIVGTLVMAFYAKLPFALAPGMGLNAFFVYSVVLGMGYEWPVALAAVFVEGVIFILLTVTNVRNAIVNAIPTSLRYAIASGIGLFIAFIGLKNAGIIVNNDATLVALGDITTGSALLGVIGIILTGLLVVLKVKGALLLGILATTVIGIFTGETHFQGIVSLPHSIAPIFCKFDFSNLLSIEFAVIVFTFMFVDLFDTVGTLIGVSEKAGMVDEKGEIKNLKKALMADAVATTAGAIVGTSTTTTYVESASGVAQGGRTGLTAFVTAICFAVALFFAPLFLSIPSAATTPALVIVGLFMMSPIKKLDLDDYLESIPAFITIIMMPLAYSISDGIMLGMISYVVLNVLCGKFSKLSPVMYILAIVFVMKYLFM
ncbi:MAG: NCS2 family permease [Bacteroidales bacterium]|nr:NCS2 family permease [Bacteroidales bacterium]